MTAFDFATLCALAEILLIMIAFAGCCVVVFAYLFVGEYRKCRNIKQAYNNVINEKMYE